MSRGYNQGRKRGLHKGRLPKKVRVLQPRKREPEEPSKYEFQGAISWERIPPEYRHGCLPNRAGYIAATARWLEALLRGPQRFVVTGSVSSGRQDEGSLSMCVGDGWHVGLNPKPIRYYVTPHQYFEVTVTKDRHLSIRSNDGVLLVLPQYANAIIVQLKPPE